MTKKYTIEDGVLKFDTKLHVLNEKKSIALLSCSYPSIKEFGIDKEVELEVTIKKKK